MRPPRAFTRTFGLAATLAVLALAFVLGSMPVHAAVDMTGTWQVEFQGGLLGPTCDAVVIQVGSDVDVAAECSITLHFQGTIDLDTGAASLTDDLLGVVVNVMVAPDGSSFKGTWTFIGSGPITGTRTSTEIDIFDFSGDWTFIFDGRDPDRICDATLTQSFTDLTASITCPSGTAAWTGTVSPFSGSFTLVPSDIQADPFIHAKPADNSSSLLIGSWLTMDQYGDLFAYRAGTSHGGILSLRCVGGGTGPYCRGAAGETVTLAVDIVLPPTDGHDGFQIGLYSAGDFPPTLSEDPATEVPGCPAAQRSVVLGDYEATVTYTCAPGDALPEASRLVELTFQCPPGASYAYTTLSVVPESTFFTQAGSQLAPFPGSGASIDCYSPEPGPIIYLPPEAFLAADVNCDGRPDSIDAALVLQQDAGLLATLPCGISGDASMDGLTNSIDASIILQISAGLVQLAPEPIFAPL